MTGINGQERITGWQVTSRGSFVEVILAIAGQPKLVLPLGIAEAQALSGMLRKAARKADSDIVVVPGAALGDKVKP